MRNSDVYDKRATSAEKPLTGLLDLTDKLGFVPSFPRVHLSQPIVDLRRVVQSAAYFPCCEF
jgi:hypothetical protein